MTTFNIQTINVHDLKKLYDESPDLCLIDVREEDEWRAVHIPGAIHMPKDQISSLIVAKITDHIEPIYLHCRGGVRSLYAAQVLHELGYTDVYSVDGGIDEWIEAGYPVKY